MTIQEWLGETSGKLRSSDTPKLDAEVLLAASLLRDRSWLHTHSDKQLDDKVVRKLELVVDRRRKHEPMAYILGYAEFYGRRFLVTNKVLVPRPETEAMVELFLDLPLQKNQSGIADVGCGSGAIGITITKENPNIKDVNFIDIDADALAVAYRNAREYKIKGAFYPGNLLEAKQMRYEILLCNLPYVPTDYKINDAARHEPMIALFGGHDGLDVYRQLFAQINTGRFGDPLVLTESLPEQHSTLADIARRVGYKLVTRKDFIQVFRRTL